MKMKILILGLMCLFVFAYCESPADPKIGEALNPEPTNTKIKFSLAGNCGWASYPWPEDIMAMYVVVEVSIDGEIPIYEFNWHTQYQSSIMQAFIPDYIFELGKTYSISLCLKESTYILEENENVSFSFVLIASPVELSFINDYRLEMLEIMWGWQVGEWINLGSFTLSKP